MKNLVKVLFAAFVLVAVSSGAFAQNASASASVGATVKSALTVSKATNGDVVFGSLAKGSTATLIPTSVVKTGVGVSASLGKFVVEGQGGANVTLSYNSTITLSDGSATPNTLTFTPAIAKSNLDNATYGSPIELNSYSINNEAGTNMSIGKDYIFVGGVIVVPSNAVAASYTGDFVLTAAYN